MVPALKWAAMRDILMFYKLWGAKPQESVHRHNFWREGKAEAESNWDHGAYQPNGLPLAQTGSLMEVGEEQDHNYTYRCTITTRMTPALKWAAMRDILMFD